MHISVIDAAAIQRGEHAFQLHLIGSACGPGTAEYEARWDRDTGISVIVGSIDACIARGIRDRYSIIRAVAKASLCRRSTVASVLDALSDDATAYRRWLNVSGRYSLRDGSISDPAILITA